MNRSSFIISDYDLDKLNKRVQEMKKRGFYPATSVKKTLNIYTGRVKYEVLMKQYEETNS